MHASEDSCTLWPRGHGQTADDFQKDGTVTAANVGHRGSAAAVVMWAARRKRGLRPSVGAELGQCGREPVMGIGPWRINRHWPKLARHWAKWLVKSRSVLISISAYERELGLDRNVCNVNSGGVAIGHPLAASGTDHQHLL